MDGFARRLAFAESEQARPLHVQRPGLHRPVADPPVDRERLVELDDAGSRVALEVALVAHAPQDVGLAPLVAQRPVQLERLLERDPAEAIGIDDPGRLERVDRHGEAERVVVERVGELRPVAVGAPQRHRLLVGEAHRRDVRLPPAHAAQRLEQPCPQDRRPVRPGGSRHGVQPPACLEQVPPHLPEPPQGEGEPDRRLLVLGRDGAVERGAEVVVLELEAVQPAGAGPGRRAWASPALQARGTRRRTGRAPPLPRRATGSLSPANSRMVSSIWNRSSPPSTTRRRLWSASSPMPSTTSRSSSSAGPHTASAAVEIDAAPEHREPVEQTAVALVEDVVAPRDRAAERLLALREVPRAAAQGSQLVRQAGEDRIRRQQLDARRRELDRERHAAQPRADRGDGRGVVVGDLEVRLDGRRTLDEQPHRLVGRQALGLDLAVPRWQLRALERREPGEIGRGRQARDGILVLAGDPERRPRGDDELEAWHRLGAGPPPAAPRPRPARSCRGRGAPSWWPASPRPGPAPDGRRVSASPRALAICDATRPGSRTASRAAK